MADSIVTGVLLAGGIGSRFRSAVPKVAHDLLGRPLCAWPAAALAEAGCARIVAVAGPATVAALTTALPAATIVVQDEPRGTGDAARVGLTAVAADCTTVLIAAGDTPCLRGETLRQLLAVHRDAGGGVTMLSARLDAPHGYGRIVRAGDGTLLHVVEERDADDAIRAIGEVNVGVIAADAAALRTLLPRLTAKNAQGEQYLTDVVHLARADGLPVRAECLASASEMQGVNDRAQLAAAAAILRDRIVAAWQAAGVTFHDPSSVWVEADVGLAPDVVIGPQVELRGGTRVASGTSIDAGCVLRDVDVGPRCHLKPYVVGERARLHAGVQVGPFAHLRPGSELHDEVRIGNFVELKNAVLGTGSKANHLSYLGDARIGARCNIGAGTITCNYDGVAKHQTTIGDGVFVGSDSQLVAPVTVGDGAYVGAGTTVTEDVPAGALAVSRTPQKHVADFARRRKIAKRQGQA